MSFIGIGLTLGLTVAPASAPTAPCIAEALPAIAAAQTRADSLRLAEHYQAAPPGGDRACGQLLAGILWGLTSSSADDAWRERQDAAELIERAIRSFGDEPRLYLALGVVLHHRQSRTDALRTLDRAEDRADRGEVPLSARERAILYYRRGLIYQDQWRDWRSFGQIENVSQGQWRCSRDESPTRDNLSGSSSDHSWLVAVNQLCPERFAENMAQYFISRREMNLDVRANMVEAFRTAWDTDPTFLMPAEAILAEWVYDADWERADSLTALLLDRYPENVWIQLYRGVVLHETGRDSAAQAVFAAARPLVPDSLALALDDITPLLTEAQQQGYAQMDTIAQQQLRVAFWTSLDPMFLTTWNERRLEHVSRVVTAGLLFAGTSFDGPGWHTYTGELWVRYGRPANIWELQIPAGRVVFWDVGPGPDFSFERGFGFRSYRPTEQARQYGNALARQVPQAYAMTNLVDSIIPLESQVVRMLGEGERPQILIYAEWPRRASDSAQAGLTLLDATYFPVAQWRGGKPTRPGIGAELNGMARGAYSLTVEVLDGPAKRLYQLRDTVSTLATPESGFAVSDLMLVTEIREPETDVSSRRQLPVTPLYGTTLAKGETLGLVWETYDIGSTDDGRRDYTVSVELLDAARQPVLARVLRGVGVSGAPPARTRIEYESSRPVVAGRTVEWLELSSDLGIGEYRLVFTIRDDASGLEATRERTLRVR